MGMSVPAALWPPGRAGKQSIINRERKSGNYLAFDSRWFPDFPITRYQRLRNYCFGFFGASSLSVNAELSIIVAAISTTPTTSHRTQ